MKKTMVIAVPLAIIIGWMHILLVTLQVKYFDAVNDGDVEKVSWSLDHGVSINVEDKYGNTGLHIAALKGHVHLVELFLKNGADQNVREGKLNHTFLDIAVLEGHDEIVAMLTPVTNKKN